MDDADPQKVYGTITDVSPTGANDVYHVTAGECTTLIPAIKQVVRAVDLDEGIMRITPLEGLFDED